MSDGMGELIEEKKTYDYIILDTPVGFGSDAGTSPIFRRYFIYCKAKLLQKEMITLLNNRVKRGSSTMPVLF
jgi:cellulose biosynthesis protein BcsQ